MPTHPLRLLRRPRRRFGFSRRFRLRFFPRQFPARTEIQDEAYNHQDADRHVSETDPVVIHAVSHRGQRAEK